jgi:hypothetical protein
MTMLVPPISPSEREELKRLWAEFDQATRCVLEIMRTEGTDNRVALDKVLVEDAKAGAALKRIEAIHRREGHNVTFPGATAPPNTFK